MDVEYELDLITATLGGPRRVGARPKTLLEAHQMILRGLPAAAAVNLIDTMSTTPWAAHSEITAALGASLSTFDRNARSPGGRLALATGGRVWTVAKVVAACWDVTGTRERAERWLMDPDSLSGERPIDLLSSPPGVEFVLDALGRMARGD